MDEDEEEALFEFVTTGEKSCERCMALAGSQWEAPPSPPHAHCQCEVDVHQKFPRLPGQSCEDTTWSFQQLAGGAVTYGNRPAMGFEWGYLVTINCWDGGVFEFEIWVDMGQVDDWPITDTIEQEIEGYVWDHIYDEVETVIANACRRCGSELMS